MGNWRVWPISVGTIGGVDKSILTYGQNHGETIEVCSLIYLLKGGPELILVDTGMSDPDWATKYHNPSLRDKSQEPTVALENSGVNPKETEIVICTHLHWDHCFNISLFPNARVIVQKDEISYALFPLPIHALAYETFLIGMTPPWLKSAGNLEIVSGDVEIVLGVSVVKLPGHTPGFQGVKVETQKGNYFIAGDFCPLYENWHDSEKEFIPAGIHVNLLDCYESYKKINSFTNFILPGHDPKVLDQECYPVDEK